MIHIATLAPTRGSRLAIGLILAAVPALAAAQSDPLCIENGRVFTGETFEPRTLCMRDGVFIEPPSPGANVDTIDADGRFLLPPFAEAHTHTFYGGEGSKATSDSLLDQGVFYALSANNPNAVADAYRDWEPESDNGRVDKVDALFTNGGFTMTEGHPVPLYRRIHTQYRGQPEETFLDSARESVFFQVDSVAELNEKWPRYLAQESDLVKMYLLHSDQDDVADDAAPNRLARGGLEPAVALELADKARAAGLRVISHIESAADIEIALEADVDALAHMPYNIRGAASAITELRTIPAPLAERLAETDTAVITTAAQGFRQLDMSPPLDDRERRAELLRGNLQRLHDADVPILVGSDMNSPVPEARILHEHGPWSAVELLRIWTVDTPRWMFPGRDIGSLTPGHEASVIGLAGDPREQFDAVGDVDLGIKQGVVLERPGAG